MIFVVYGFLAASILGIVLSVVLWIRSVSDIFYLPVGFLVFFGSIGVMGIMIDILKNI